VRSEDPLFSGTAATDFGRATRSSLPIQSSVDAPRARALSDHEQVGSAVCFRAQMAAIDVLNGCVNGCVTRLAGTQRRGAIEPSTLYCVAGRSIGPRFGGPRLAASSAGP
jgi:hypothetical protein